jgi:hypothetical protein
LIFNSPPIIIFSFSAIPQNFCSTHLVCSICW